MLNLSGSQRMGAAAILLAASALLSRLMGLARDKIISWQFGAGNEADLYFAAFITPDIINYLLAGGFMSITIIPILGRLFERDEKDAWEFFSCVACWMTLGAIVFTMIGEIWARPLAAACAPGFSPAQQERLARFTRIILPGQIFFLAGAPFTALLFLRRQFAVPALSPLLYNGCIILLGVSLPLLPFAGSGFGMTGYCIGVSAGAFLGAFLLPVAIAISGGVRFRIRFSHPGMRKFLMIALPLMLGQTVVMLDEQFLRIFGSMAGEGQVSILNYARRIAQVPVSLVGQAAAVASYPFLVKLLAANDIKRFNETLNKALDTSLSLIIPCAMWMLALALPILGAIFEGGRFGPEHTLACELPTRLMLAATPVWIIYMILARAFYAHEDTLTPAITGTVITIFCIPAYQAAASAGSWAIALVSGLALFCYVVWLMLIWIRRHGGESFAGLGGTIMKSLALSLAPAAGAWFAQGIVPESWFAGLPFFRHCLAAGIGSLAFALLFLPAIYYFQPDLLKKLARRK